MKVAIGDSGYYGKIKVYNENLTLVNTFQAHTNYINRIKQLPNGYVATVSSDNTAKIWDATIRTNWILIRNYTKHVDQVYGLEYINEDTIASGGYDHSIQMWSIQTGITKMNISTGHIVWSLQLLTNGYYLAAGLSNSFINIYNINNVSLIASLKGHTSSLFELLLIGSNLLASGDSNPDDVVRIWDLTTYTSKYILFGHNNSVCGLKLISSDILASGSMDSTIKLWNITCGSLIKTFRNHTLGIGWSVDMLNTQILVSGSFDGIIKLWNMKTGEVLNTISTGDTGIRSMAVLDVSTTSK
jgi:WD40 repeat protein